MSFTKTDLDLIKSKILLSGEIEKKTKLHKKGKDYWGCCIFHKEKTASFKINDELGSFYCFGCGAKGDIFSLYTDLYNYSFQEAVIELGKKAGITIKQEEYHKRKDQDKIYTILKTATEWFQQNLYLENGNACLKYLKSRKLSKETIKKFQIGFSYNSSTTLYKYLKEKKLFEDKDILKSNLVKLDDKNNIKDYFYKRVIFPITDERGNVVGFGGRALNNINPKYINSPESYFFKKRYLLYNLFNAKNTARKKNNLLICEGYMDVISLNQNGIESVVAPLGTSFTEQQLNLAWKFSSKPTIMFDGDQAGLRAAFKLALMSLSFLQPNKFLQFINLENGLDPDSYINKYSFKNLLTLLKKPASLVNFIFQESIKAFSLQDADDKIAFDKYLDDLIDKIGDKKIKFFYKNEFKSLFFTALKNRTNRDAIISKKTIKDSLINKQILSFIAACVNHKSVRSDIISVLLKTNLFNNLYQSLLTDLKRSVLSDLERPELLEKLKNAEYAKILANCQESSIYQLFPYSSPKYNDALCLEEVTKSSKNLNTRLLNLKKINKSLDDFEKNSSQLNWDELKRINRELS
ncbi:MAG: DNA primase [Alphaproteobacteria bacterium MarineAlpha5_Bin7]|nr:MAG: DNA primase [Alphaproteobacteria bacterium MarineAlpha5_Bin7]|tara:strand:+ start:2885 stop:4618 length:1734 start_codon:yes stop_codon:yes gene_type:complete